MGYTNTIKENEVIGDILDLLAEGEEIIDVGRYEDVFLILGKTGTGKSTLAQFISGNSSRLISKAVGDSEFIIKDLDEKTSNDSTIISQTVFPELMYDEELNIPFYDCPGFVDTRSSSIDIAATYFIHKVIVAAKRVKAMFVVNFPAVREGVDRNDFMNLLLHATNLFKNVENFNNSIVLVVTKVDTIYDKHGNFPSDEKVIGNIANFLKNAKLSIRDILAGNPGSKRIYYENAIKIINIFLTQINGNYVNIGIFRRPDDPGLLSENSLMQENRIKLKKMMQFSIEYANVRSDDFGYTISDESRNFIHGLYEYINILITEEIAKWIEIIPKDFELSEKSMKDLDLFRDEVNMKYSKLMILIDSLRYISKPKDIATKLAEFFASEGISNSNQILENIEACDEFLRFLELVSSKILPTKANDLIAPLVHIANDLLNTKNIYTLFNDLFLKLSSYDVQKNPERFNTLQTMLRDEISVLKKTNSHMHGTRLTEYLKEFYREDISNRITIPGFEETKNCQIISTTKLQILDDILNYTLVTKSSSSTHNGSVLSVYGSYVKVTDILKLQSNWKTLQVFATNKFFIDADYEIKDISGEVKIIILAPIWEIINNKKIVLIGQNGRAHSINKAACGLNAQGVGLNGITGGTGQNGLPGMPGQPGGSIFGIGNFINGQSLVVSSVGGNGGRGQDGGNGGNGSDGKTADYTFTRDDKIITLFYNEVIEKYNRNSGFGGVGGQGGDGGLGGLPGAGSEIKIFALSDNSTFPKLKIINGNKGESGLGGTGGRGGLGGLFSSKENAMKFVGPIPVELGERNEVCEPRIRAASGNDGSQGRNVIGIQQPMISSGNQQKQDYVQSYKNWLPGFFSANRVPKSTSKAFVTRVDNIKFC